MASATNPAVQSYLSGLFKEVYIDSGLVDLVPEAAKLVKAISFEKGQTLGDKFVVPVVLSDEQGLTYAAAGAGNFAIGGSVSMNTQKAMIDGAQMLLQSALDLESIARSQQSKAAFTNATQLKVKNVLSSGRKRLEISMLYGQSGLGAISGLAASGTAGTAATVTISADSFAPLIWVGKKNAKIVVYDSATQVGSSPGAASPTNVFTIVSVDVANRNLVVSGGSSDITALLAATPSATLQIYFESTISGSGTVTHADQLGLYSQITSTASRFNIDPTAYDLWGGNTYAVGSKALTFKSLMAAIGYAVNRGLDQDVTVWVHPSTWNDLLTDQAALRKYDASYSSKKLEQGAESLEFHGVSGKVKVEAHGCIKAGQAFVLPMEELMRVGAADFSFNVPGAGGMDGGPGEIFISDPSYAGFLFRAYSHQQVVDLAPAKSVVLTGISNSN